MTRILFAIIAFYRRWLSPPLHFLSPGGCKYLPTCSEYAAVAISTHGPLRGGALAAFRLLRCHPFARGGLDPVPPSTVRPSSNATCDCRAMPLKPARKTRVAASRSHSIPVDATIIERRP
jgi:uncharacterized protein